MRFYLTAIIGGLGFYFSSALQASPIQPDRPGFSTGTYTLEPGVSHIESGVQKDYGLNAGDSDSYVAPLINYRLGLSTDTELNILWDGWSWLSGEANKNTESSDVMLGVKQSIITSSQYNLSWLAYISIASSSSQGTNGFLGGLWDYSLSDDVLAFGTLQVVSSFDDDDSRVYSFQPALGLSFSHTDKISSFIELYQDMPMQGGAENNSTVDAGVAYLLTDDIQLDVNFGLSLDQRTSDFMGVGIAVRF